MSETDDEIEDDWFVQRHLEHLDITAREEQWSEMKRELNRRWDEHRLEEKLEHPRYVSDSLVRFVRRHRPLAICTHDLELAVAFKQLVGDLTKDTSASMRRLDTPTSSNMIHQNAPQRSSDISSQPRINGITNGIYQ